MRLGPCWLRVSGGGKMDREECEDARIWCHHPSRHLAQAIFLRDCWVVAPNSESCVPCAGFAAGASLYPVLWSWPLRAGLWAVLRRRLDARRASWLVAELPSRASRQRAAALASRDVPGEFEGAVRPRTVHSPSHRPPPAFAPLTLSSCWRVQPAGIEPCLRLCPRCPVPWPCR